jgi:Hint module
VEAKDRGIIQMTQLQIGDFVKSGRNQFTQVYGFGHLDRDREELFLQIAFHDDDINQEANEISYNLEISAEHLVYVNKNQQTYYMQAADVVEGDELSGKRVKSIHPIVRRGVYAPLTHSGDIAISGIVVSNYVALLRNWFPHRQQHYLGHFLFYPQRLFCSYFIEACMKEKYINSYGYLAYLIVYGSSILMNFDII